MRYDSITFHGRPELRNSPGAQWRCWLAAASVVIPVRNRLEQLGRAIRSVLDQEYADFELIVVDDCSTDDCRGEVEAIGDPRIRYIRQEANRGSCAARNTGIRAAATDLICFLDSDDIYLPDKLGTVVRIFGERPDLDVLVDSYVLRYPAGRDRCDAIRVNRPLEGEDFATALFARRLWKATPGISVRRDAAFRAGLFNESLQRRQDFDFLARLARCSRCAATDRILWVKSWSASSISTEAETYIPATIQLCRQNPNYLSDARLSRGLARDLVRQIVRLAKVNGLGAAARGTGEVAREFGLIQSLKLALSGSREIFARSRERRRLGIRRYAPASEGRAARGSGSGSKSRVRALDNSPTRATR